MRKSLVTLKLLALLYAALPAFSQQSWPSALLWRINGNGLNKPSYLYGTMHMKDRRLFFFGDSLYNAIETTSGFAMELDPAEMIDSLFSRLSNEFDGSPFLKDVVGQKKFDKVSGKLEKKLGMPAEKVTRKQLIETRRNWIYKNRKPDDMKTAVDLYLFDLAKQQGKWTGGIEDVSDQLDLLDELGNYKDIDKYIDDIDNEKLTVELEKMISVYVSQDINKLEKMISSKDATDIALLKRNIKMARRIDSLATIRNTFFAVGAAHLPGDSGLIKLLRSRGFTVEPVFSSKTIAPEKYSFVKTESPWFTYTSVDSAYTVEMPGKPSDFNLFGDEVKFKVYADLSNGAAYMTGFVFIAEGEEEKKLQDIKGSLTGKNYKKLYEKKIVKQEMKGTELHTIKDEIYYRIQLFANNSKVYIVMATAEKQDQLDDRNANRFFESFTPNTAVQKKRRNWIEYSDAVKGFSLSFPGKPVKQKQVNATENFDMATYASIDVENSTYYMLAVAETQKGFMITDDSLIFNSKAEYYKQNGYTIKDFRKFEFNDYPAINFTAEGKEQGTEIASKLLVVSRGNRSYSLIVVTEKGKEDYPDITRFFRSFSLLPYQTSGWTEQQAPNKDFTVWVPSAIWQQHTDTSGLTAYELEKEQERMQNEIQYAAFDTNTTTNYNITLKTISKYYWAKNDSAFFENQAGDYYQDTSSYFAKYNPGNFDSLIYKKQVTNAGDPGCEILVKNQSKSYYKRLRLIRHGNTVCHLLVISPFETITNSNNNRFFETFGFNNKTVETSVFKNKTQLILDDLLSKDSAVNEAATNAFNTTKFSAEDAPLLQRAFLKDYPDDTLEYNSITDRIASKLEEINDTSNTTFVENNYLTIPDSSSKRMRMLELLAAAKTKTSLLLLKDFLLKSQPARGYINGTISSLEDTLSLSKSLFPDITTIFTDTVWGTGFISLAVSLTDSNMLEKNLLVNHNDKIKSTARWQLKKLSRSKDEYDSYYGSIIKALRIIGDTESTEILNGYSGLSQSYIKKDALITLLHMGKEVSPAKIHSLAADPEYRVMLYDTLNAMKKAPLFPKEFLSQQKFAESYLMNYAYEDDIETSDITFQLLGEKTNASDGITSKYYVFKVTLKYDTEKYEYPAICGPFDINKMKLKLSGDQRVQIFYDEKIKPTAANVNKLFALFLDGY